VSRSHTTCERYTDTDRQDAPRTSLCHALNVWSTTRRSTRFRAYQTALLWPPSVHLPENTAPGPEGPQAHCRGVRDCHGHHSSGRRGLSRRSGSDGWPPPIPDRAALFGCPHSVVIPQAQKHEARGCGKLQTGRPFRACCFGAWHLFRASEFRFRASPRHGGAAGVEPVGWQT
jgi:hypothetical protein